MAIYIGTTDLDNTEIKLGTNDVDKMYLGTTEVWSGAPYPLIIQNKTIQSVAGGGGGFAIRGNGTTSLYARAGAGAPFDEGIAVNVINAENFGSGTSEALVGGSFPYGLRLRLVATGLQIQVLALGGGWTNAYSSILTYTSAVGFPSTTVSSGNSGDHVLEVQGSGFSFRIRYIFAGSAYAYSDWMLVTEVT